MRSIALTFPLACLALASCRSGRNAEVPIATVQLPPDWLERSHGREPFHGKPSEELVGPVVLDSEYWSIWDADSVHRKLTGQARDTGAKIDEYLSNDRSTSEENESWFQAETRTFIEDGEGLDAKLKIRAHLALPRSENRAQIVFNGEDDDNRNGLDDPDTLQAVDPVQGESEDDERSVALKYFAKATKSNNVSFSGGLKFNGLSPNPFGSVRWRHEKSYEWATFRATERYRYFLEEGGESRTVVDLERDLTDEYFLRFTTTGDWFEEEVGFYYGAFVTLYEQHPRNKLLSYELGSTYATEPNNVLTSIFARVRGRRLFAREWLLLEVAPQITWRRQDDYEPTLGLLVSLRMTFRQRDLIENPLDP